MNNIIKKQLLNQNFNKFNFKKIGVENLRQFSINLSQKIVEELKPKSVLDLNCENPFLVSELRRRGVEAFGVSSLESFDNMFEFESLSKFSEFYFFNFKFIDSNWPVILPKKFDLVICNGFFNKFYAENLKTVVSKVCGLSTDFLIGFYKQLSMELGEVNFSRLVGFFSENEVFKVGDSFFKNKFCEINLFSNQISEVDVVQFYENQIYKLNLQNVELLNLNRKLNQKIEYYIKRCVNLKQAGQSYIELKHEFDNNLFELNFLRANDEQSRAIIDSFFWKATKPIRKSIDLFKKLIRLFTGSLISLFKHKAADDKELATPKNKSNNIYTNYFLETKPTLNELSIQRKVKFKKNYTISIIVPLYNTPIEFLKELINSVNRQTYPFWQLCLADGSDAFHFKVRALCESYASQNSNIKYVKLEKNLGIAQNTNEALKLATGHFVALLDHDDLLSPSALFECVQAIEQEGADFVYTDELIFKGSLENIEIIHFKSDFSPDALRSNNYICHLSVFSMNLIKEVGGFSSNFDGSQDYDLILRLTEKAKKVVHIPKALYYWRSHSESVAQDLINKPYCLDSAKKTLAAHIKRLGLQGEVFDSRYPSTYRIKYKLNSCLKVSIIIINSNSIGVLKTSIESILNTTTYVNFEIIVVDVLGNEQTFDFYELLKHRDDRIKIFKFNFNDELNLSAAYNFGVANSTGSFIVLLSNFIKITTPDWLEQMMSYAQRVDVGAVGAKLFFPDNTIYGGGFFLSENNIAVHAFRLLAKNDGGYMCRASLVQNLSAVNRRCLMTRRDLWNKFNGFNEHLFLNFNDVDFCLRLRKAGLLIVYDAYVEIEYCNVGEEEINRSVDGVVILDNEKAYMKSKWSNVLKYDPYYNLNFDSDSCNFSVKL